MYQVAAVSGRCLVNHAPSPQQCAQSGGIWDDTLAATATGAGGKCVPESKGLLKMSITGVEMVEVNVTHDGQSKCEV